MCVCVRKKTNYFHLLFVAIDRLFTCLKLFLILTDNNDDHDDDNHTIIKEANNIEISSPLNEKKEFSKDKNSYFIFIQY